MLMQTAVGVDIEDPGIFVKGFCELADVILIECIDIEAHNSNDRVIVIRSRGHGDFSEIAAVRVDIAPEDSINTEGGNTITHADHQIGRNLGDFFGDRAVLSLETLECQNCPGISDKEGILVETINLADKLSTFSEHWQPRVVGQFNGNDVMVVKVKGEFVWHKHDETDDFFLVLKGRIDIQMRNEIVTLGPGELFVVPKGVEHRPVAVEEAHVLLIEPRGTPNTGNANTAAARRVV